MANAPAPTRLTRHLEIRRFALLQWVEDKKSILEAIPTDANHINPMIKALARTTFHQDADVYMGRVPPSYVTQTPPVITHRISLADAAT